MESRVWTKTIPVVKATICYYITNFHKGSLVYKVP